MAISAQILKVNHWHQRLAEWLIVNPHLPLSDAAKHFQVSPAWLSTVKNSDAFVDYFNELSKAHAEAILTSVRDKAVATADSAIGEIQRRLEADATTIPYGQLLETADILLKRALPAEQKPVAAPQVQVNVGLVTQEELAQARLAMRQRQAPVGTLELDAKDITPPGER